MGNTLRKCYREQLATNQGVSSDVRLPYVKPVVTRTWETGFISSTFNLPQSKGHQRRCEEPTRPSKDLLEKEGHEIFGVTTLQKTNSPDHGLAHKLPTAAVLETAVSVKKWLL